ncbi:MAG: hypothetical protein AAGA66_13240 [Bacteroidota bacterium]
MKNLMMTKIAIIFSFLFITHSGFCENPCGIMTPRTYENWGHGLIFIAQGSEIELYNEEKKVIGYVKRSDDWHARLELNDSTLPNEINRNDHICAGQGEIRFLIVFDYGDNMYKVLSNSFDKDIYINLEGLVGESVFVRYNQIFEKNDSYPEELNRMIGGTEIGVNETKFCMNLRSEPNTSCEVIKCISAFARDEYTHFDILTVKGNWAKVKSNVYTRYQVPEDDYHECPYKLTDEKIGWINIVDHKGFPNLWFSVSSY